MVLKTCNCPFEVLIRDNLSHVGAPHLCHLTLDLSLVVVELDVPVPKVLVLLFKLASLVLQVDMLPTQIIFFLFKLFGLFVEVLGFFALLFFLVE
jgi:hypothetical protein